MCYGGLDITLEPRKKRHVISIKETLNITTEIVKELSTGWFNKQQRWIELVYLMAEKKVQYRVRILSAAKYFDDLTDALDAFLAEGKYNTNMQTLA